MATEAECVAEGSTYLALLWSVEGEVHVIVDVLILVTILVIDCWRDDIVLHSENTNHSFERTSSTEKVTCH